MFFVLIGIWTDHPVNVPFADSLWSGLGLCITVGYFTTDEQRS